MWAVADDDPTPTSDAAPPSRRAGARRRQVLAWCATTLALVAVVAGFLVTSTVVVVRQRLLDETTYTGALARAEVYDRVYTDVLADPELGEARAGLLGGVDLRGIDPDDARILATNSLRWALPPSTLRGGTERFIAALVAYIRGDTVRLDATVNLDAVLADLEDAAINQIRSALARVRDDAAPASSLDGYRAAVAQVAERVAAGRLPTSLPTAGPGLADADVVAVVLSQLDERAAAGQREVVEAEVAAGNRRDALITALSTLVRPHADAAERGLRSRLADGRRFDPVAELADRHGESELQVVRRLNRVRDAASWFGPPALVFGLVMMLAGAAGLVGLHRARPARAALALAGALVLAGATTAAAWWVVRGIVAPPLRAATGTGPGTWDLPPGLRGVVRDVEAELAGTLGATVVRLAAVPIVAGLAVGAAVAVLALLRRREPAEVRRPRRVPAGVAIGVAAGVAAVVSAVVVAAPASGAGERACNGHTELCSRSYDEVVQAATHNSMSSPDVVQVWPEHDGTIGEQLDAGIRALLVDTHFWTDVVSPDQVADLDPAIPAPLAARAVERANDRWGARPGIFLCHNHCVWGGRPLVDGLEDVAAFLAANPDEVVTLIVQDETPAADTVDVFADAGLVPYVYVHDGGEWPTLGEMIDTGRRLVVFAENDDSGPDWYHPAFASITDTPFGFATPEQMSCDPNRGPDDAPLFLMNHWVSRVAPDRQTATVVNAHDAVVGRARRCASERGRLPNFVAVDFYGIGDVLAAVDELNGVAG
jgi:hypothetical protein